MFYNIPREVILNDYTWEEVQFRVNQIPISKLITITPGMKKFDIDESYRLALMDKQKVSNKDQRKQYDDFLERLRKAKSRE